MADRSIQERSMRKTVERVDVGLFGIPLRLAAWRRSMRSTWSGLLALLAVRAVSGLALAFLAGFLLGVPLNALSTVLTACFVAGCMIGGPIAFTIWSLLLIPLTGLVGGLAGGAWVASPSWWRVVAANWNSGQAVPGWFMVALPAWLLFWVATSYAVSRGVDALYERMSLQVGFRAASRFSREDERIRNEAFDESDLSAAESRSVLDRDDGTGAVVAIGAPTVVPGVRLDKVVELGEERVVDDSGQRPGAVDYESELDMGLDDPDVRRAVGGHAATSLAVEREGDPDEVDENLPAIPEQDVAAATAVSVPIVPTVPVLAPSSTGPAVRTVEPPVSDALASRAMVRKLTQLVLAFNTAEFENSTEQFLLDAEDEFARLSDEQMRLLGTIDNAGPLIAFAASVKQSRLDEYLMGRSDPPVPDGLGAFPAASEDSAGSSVIPSEVTSERAVDEGEGDADPAAEDDSMIGGGGDIASMASAFSTFLRRPSARLDQPTDDPGAGSVGAGSGLQGGDLGVPRPEETSDVDAGAGAPAFSPADGTTVAPVETSSADATGVVDASGADGKTLRFVVDLQKGAAGREGADDVDEPMEEEMSALVFGRLICRQVLALVSGPLDVADKASDVLEFETANPGVLVSQVINSRSFDDYVGPKEAAEGRHAWREVRLVLSHSGVDRLVADFNRVNERGRRLLEAPHTLTQALFHSFETESVRLRQAVGVNDEMMAATMELYKSNTDIQSGLKRTLVQRAEAAARGPATPQESMSQTPPADDLAEAARGRSMFGSMVGRTRDSGLEGVLSNADTHIAANGPEEEDVTATDVPHLPDLGDEGFVSPHAEGSDAFAAQMEEHGVLLDMRRERRRREAEAAGAATGAPAHAAEDPVAVEARRSEALRNDAAYVEAERAASEARAAAESDRAETARLEKERLQREAARGSDDEAALAAHRARLQALAVPPRFDVEHIVFAASRMADLRDIRRGLISSGIGALAVSESSGVSEALLSPVRRSQLVIAIEIGRNAALVRDALCERLQLPSDASAPDIRAHLDGDEESRFFNKIDSEIATGISSANAVRQAEEELSALRAAAAGAGEVSALRATVERREGDVEVARGRIEELERAVEADRARVATAERDLEIARAETRKLRDSLAGVVDDDFQKLLDRYATNLPDAPMDGFFVLASPDRSSVVLLATFPAASLPEGMVMFRDKLRPLLDVVRFLFGKVADLDTDHREFVFTDTRMRSVIGQPENGLVVSHLARDAAALTTRLRALDIPMEKPE